MHVTFTNAASMSNRGSRAISSNCRMPSASMWVCISVEELVDELAELLDDSMTVKINSGSGSGSLPSEHSTVTLNKNEFTSSRQKSIPAE